jgi:hypothetical protein
LARRRADGVRNGAHVPRRTIRHQQSMFEVPIGRTAGHAIEQLPNQHDVVGMRSLQHQSDGRPDRSLVAEDPKRFVRPDEFVIGESPAKTPV